MKDESAKKHKTDKRKWEKIRVARQVRGDTGILKKFSSSFHLLKGKRTKVKNVKKRGDAERDRDRR